MGVEKEHATLVAASVPMDTLAVTVVRACVRMTAPSTGSVERALVFVMKAMLVSIAQ